MNRPPVRWAVLALVAATIAVAAAYSYRRIDSELTTMALSRREAVAELMAGTLAEKFVNCVTQKCGLIG